MNKFHIIVLVSILILHGAVGYLASRKQFVVVDEAAHFPSGLLHWTRGDFSYYRVNPPLIRMLATLPLLMADVQVKEPILTGHPFERPEIELARSFARSNASRYMALLGRSRSVILLISLAGGVVAYLWSRSLYGPTGGLLSLVAWCSWPMVLAHSTLVVPDLGSAVFGLLSLYTFWRWTLCNSFGRTVQAGVALGLAQLSKTTLLLWYPLLLVLWGAWAFVKRPPESKSGAGAFPQLVGIFILSWWTLLVGYGLVESGLGSANSRS